ncbi:hypothetical protein RCJ22_27275 [Vibrio sp. FNV 38]|nr:hypothetical protein [Vibrio sp. FNV 38]
MASERQRLWSLPFFLLNLQVIREFSILSEFIKANASVKNNRFGSDAISKKNAQSIKVWAYTIKQELNKKKAASLQQTTQ